MSPRLCQNLTYEEILWLYEGLKRITSPKFYTKEQVDHLKQFHDFSFKEDGIVSSYGWHNHTSIMALVTATDDEFHSTFGGYEGHTIQKYMGFIDNNIRPVVQKALNEND